MIKNKILQPIWPPRQARGLRQAQSNVVAGAVRTVRSRAHAMGASHLDRGATTSNGAHKIPTDFKKAINSDPIVKGAWADITPLARNEWICWVTSAKQEETRKRRIEVGLDKMRKGMRRPCCWSGCSHR